MQAIDNLFLKKMDLQFVENALKQDQNNNSSLE